MNVVHKSTTLKAITSGECLASYYILTKPMFCDMPYWLSKVNYCSYVEYLNVNNWSLMYLNVNV